MPRDVSLAVSIKDNFTAPLSKASQSLQKLRQDAEKMGDKIDALNKKKAALTVDATKAKKELKAAEKALDDTKEAAERLEKAKYGYEGIQTELSGITAEAKSTQKELNYLNGIIQKKQNRAGWTTQLQEITAEAKSAQKELNSLNDTIQRQQNRAGGTTKTGITGLFSQLGQAGAAQLIGEVASEAAGAYIVSAFGTEAGTMFSSMLSLGASGAAIGSLIAPGIGTLIGGGIGTLLGAVSGSTQNFQNEDEYFKSYVSDQYNQYQQEIQDTLTEGIGTAAGREQSLLAFSTILGSEESADQFMTTLQDFAAKSPFSRSGLEQISKNLIVSGFRDTDEQLAMMTAIGDAGSALGMDESGMADVATYLGRMNSTGKTSLDYLIPLMERSIPAVDYLAEHFGVAKEEVYDMVSKGLIPGAEAARAIAEGMGREFSGSMELQAQTYAGLVSTLEDNRENLNAAMGEGYIETRKSGLSEEISYLEGETGEEMQRMYRLIGEYQASLDNERDEAIRKAMEDATKSDEYLNARLQNDGAEMGRILMEAKAAAEAEYTNSDAYNTLVESQESALEGVRETLSDAYWQAGYDLMLEFQKGQKAAAMEKERENVIYSDPVLQQGQSPSVYTAPTGLSLYSGYQIPGHAAGLSYVPYNGYPAMLHEGERVLTARENREYQTAGRVTVSVNGNLVVREEADVDKIAEQLARKIIEARSLAAW